MRLPLVCSRTVSDQPTRRAAFPECARKELNLIWHATSEELYKVCDVVTLNCPRHPETEYMINNETLKHFKRGAYASEIVARGSRKDEGGLAA